MRGLASNTNHMSEVFWVRGPVDFLLGKTLLL